VGLGKDSADERTADNEIREGLQDMWDWAKTQPMRERPTMKYEIETGMYSSWKKGV